MKSAAHSGAAMRLLDAELSAEDRAEWTSRVAQPRVVSERGTESLFIFRIGSEWLALPTETLKEIAVTRTIHSIPHRDNDAILGLVNVRGELLVCVSLHRLLGQKATHSNGHVTDKRRKKRMLVLERDGSRTVFPVDEISGTHRLAAGELIDLPPTIANAAASYTKALLTWQDKSVGVLDDRLLLDSLDRRLASITAI